MKKFLLVIPPVCYAVEPQLACATLLAQLKNNGVDASVLDMSIDFINKVYTSKYLRQSFDKAKKQYKDLIKTKKLFLKSELISYEDKVLNYKYDRLNSFFESCDEEFWKKIINLFDKTMSCYKEPQKFYNYKNIIKANYMRAKAEEVISLPYYPLSISLFGSSIPNDFISFDYEDIKKVIFDSSVNIYKSFIEEQVKIILKKGYDCVGISINSDSQLIGGLTLASLLKEKTNVHVCIGGNFFSRVQDGLKKNPEFFEIFADSILVGEGELSIVELAKYINDEISIEDVPSLIYKNNGIVISNKMSNPCVLSRISIPDFSDYDFTKYFSPEPIIPVQIQRGCYWRKCTFCDMTHGKTFTVKSIEAVIKELEHYKEKYNVSHFEIVDEAMVPQYLDKLSDSILEKKLDIKFHLSLRFEQEFDEKLLKKAYSAGLRYVQWGVETGNERIHKLINKGVNFENRLNILKKSNDVGIVNCAMTFYGFPSEQYKEAMDTHDFIFDNTDCVHITATGPFKLGKHSIVNKNPELFGVVVSEEQQDFSSSLNYTDLNGMTIEEKNNFGEKFVNSISEFYGNSIFYYLRDCTLLFLYNCKHNLDYLKKIDTTRL